MSALNQAGLQRHSDILTTNGRGAEAQAVIEPAGYGLAQLDYGRELHNLWMDSKTRHMTLRTRQKQSTLAETQAKELAGRQITMLREAIRTLFPDDIPLLTSLEIHIHQPVRRDAAASSVENGHADGPAQTEAETPADPPVPETAAAGAQSDAPQGEPERAGPAPRRHLNQMAVTFEAWWLFITHVQNLPEAQLAILASFGWPAERLSAIAGLVRGFADADTVQQVRMAERQAEASYGQKCEADLRRWYTQAARFCRMAIKQLPPEKQPEMLLLLGLS